jgi:hypothetical protein
MEEGTQAGWLVEILSPHAERVVTLRVPESRGAKSDERDAFGRKRLVAVPVRRPGRFAQRMSRRIRLRVLRREVAVLRTGDAG